MRGSSWIQSLCPTSRTGLEPIKILTTPRSDVCDVYKKETERDLLKINDFVALDSVDALVQRIETRVGDFSNWRQRHEKLWERLSTCLNIVTRVGEVIKPAVSLTPFAPAAPVLGAVLFLIHASEGVTKAYDWIDEVFTELEDYTDRLRLYCKSDMDNVMKRKAIATLKFLLKVIERSEHLIRCGRFGQYLKNAFLSKDSKTSKLVDELNQLYKSEQGYVIAATYQKISTGTEKTMKTLKDVAKSVKGKEFYNPCMNLESEPDQLQALDLSATNKTFELYSEHEKDLLPGTGGWIGKELLFTAWMRTTARILWVFGGPGTGKSYLSTWIIGHLEDLYGKDRISPEGVAVGFFYVREDEEQLRGANNILKTMAWQIAQNDALFKQHATERAIDRLAILVIDGLDEAPMQARKKLLKCFLSLKFLTSEDNVRIKVAIIGRGTLKRDIDFRPESIEITEARNKGDLEIYIENRLSGILLVPKLELLDQRKTPKGREAQKCCNRLKKRITVRADGVFLWTKLLLEQIQRKDLQAVITTLEESPSSLEDMIRNVFQRLVSEAADMDLVGKILTLTCYARRPLFFGEILLALQVLNCLPNVLLCDTFLGELASIYQLKIPVVYGDQNAGQLLNEDLTESLQQLSNMNRTNLNDTNRSEADDEDEEDSFEALLADRGRDFSPQDIQEDGFSEAQLWTPVMFSHQNFKAFIVHHPKKLLVKLAIDSARSQVDMVLINFGMLRIGYARTNHRKYMVDYPARHLIYHIDEIDRTAITTNEKQKIIEGILWMFYHEDGIKELFSAPIGSDTALWADLWTTWVTTTRYANLVQDWLHDATSILECFDEDVESWIRTASSSTKVLFNPWLTGLARMWL
ncbi:MAG: hypothetical protein M1834_007053 [Cirrosporium novae-zelandiae]|nr:MAG: hypothetical protein M1834_007053 [Cirrosporium novae-zelandiae]